MHICSRFETVNAMLERFSVRTVSFRHEVQENQTSFKEVANICHLLTMYEKPRYSIKFILWTLHIHFLKIYEFRICHNVNIVHSRLQRCLRKARRKSQTLHYVVQIF